MIRYTTILYITLGIFIASFAGFYAKDLSRKNTSIFRTSRQEVNLKDSDSLSLVLQASNITLPGYVDASYQIKADSVAANSWIKKMRVPKVSQRFYRPAQTKKIRQSLARINRLYGPYIKQASYLTNVPETLIMSFIFIESGGKARSINRKSGATGLMQLTEGSCSDIIYLENKLHRLNKEKKEILRKTIGSRLDCILSMKHMGQKRRCNGNIGYNISVNDLRDPEFNILCGSIFLEILIKRHTERGVMRLDKIVAKYNIGFFTKIVGNTPEEVMMHTNRETRQYIRKLAGRNGLLDLATI